MGHASVFVSKWDSFPSKHSRLASLNSAGLIPRWKWICIRSVVRTVTRRWNRQPLKCQELCLSMCCLPGKWREWEPKTGLCLLFYSPLIMITIYIYKMSEKPTGMTTSYEVQSSTFFYAQCLCGAVCGGKLSFWVDCHFQNHFHINRRRQRGDN